MNEPDPDRRRRIALYSHDTVGLGHLRRNLAIASVLVQDSVPTDVLLISGSRESISFAVPDGIDFLTLPALAKRDGAYTPRTLAATLAEVVDLRSRIIAAALTSFEPDVLIVDKVARGVCGELDLAMRCLAGRTRCVLGLRDVLDDVSTTRTEWLASGLSRVVAERYDAVWVYGDPTVFDLTVEYGWTARITERLTFTGYLAHGRPGSSTPADPATPQAPYVLCLVGGGQDGVALADAFTAERLPEGREGVVVTGPYMDPVQRGRLVERAARRRDLTVYEFVEGCAGLIAGADAVVSMGGYNTVCELLAAGSRPLIVPRVKPRTEQLIRAKRLAARGLVDVLHPDRLTSAALAGWLGGSGRTVVATGTPVDLCGLARIPGLVDRLLVSRPVGQRPADHAA
ncbi:MAG: glycosyltransferase family protein [Ilumatobacteraceae bacterium]